MISKVCLAAGFVSQVFAQTGGPIGSETPMNSGSSSPIDVDVDIPSNYATDVVYFPDGSFLPFANPVDECVMIDSQTDSITYAYYECIQSTNANETDTVEVNEYSDATCETSSSNDTRTWVVRSDATAGDIGTFACDIEDDYYVQIAIYEGTGCSGPAVLTRNVIPGVCSTDVTENEFYSHIVACSAELEGVVFRTYENSACSGDPAVGGTVEVDFGSCSDAVYNTEVVGAQYSVMPVATNSECYFVEENENDDSVARVSTSLVTIVALMASLWIVC